MRFKANKIKYDDYKIIVPTNNDIIDDFNDFDDF